MSLDFAVDQSTLAHVMTWCRQTPSHYLSQYWPRPQSAYGVTRPQWVSPRHILLCHIFPSIKSVEYRGCAYTRLSYTKIINILIAINCDCFTIYGVSFILSGSSLQLANRICIHPRALTWTYNNIIQYTQEHRPRITFLHLISVLDRLLDRHSDNLMNICIQILQTSAVCKSSDINVGILWVISVKGYKMIIVWQDFSISEMHCLPLKIYIWRVLQLDINNYMDTNTPSRKTFERPKIIHETALLLKWWWWRWRWWWRR